jgi:hypothetical protein
MPDPKNLEILYNLGPAALEAGHATRATAVLERFTIALTHA